MEEQKIFVKSILILHLKAPKGVYKIEKIYDDNEYFQLKEDTFKAYDGIYEKNTHRKRIKRH